MTIFEREMKAAMEKRAQEVREKFRLHCKCGVKIPPTHEMATCRSCDMKAKMAKGRAA